MTVVPIPTPPQRGMDTTDEEQVALLKRTIVPETITDDEFAVFLRVSSHTGLDPFRRQIYAIHRWDNKAQTNRMTIQTGIDGYRAIAARTGEYAGQDDAIFEGRAKNKLYPGKATVTVYRIVAGLRCPFTASARWDEYVPPDNQAYKWKSSPHLMLGKCAEALALRKAFPEETAGIYVTEEMEQQDANDRTISPNPPQEPEPLSREDRQAERFQALPVNLKVEFTNWLKTEGWEKPYSDEALDAITAKLDVLDPDSAEEPTEDAAPVARTPEEPCAFCGSTRSQRVMVDGVLRCARRNDCDKRVADKEPLAETAPDAPPAPDPCGFCGSTESDREVTLTGTVQCISQEECDRRRQDNES